ncbi:MAG: thiol-disulfide interchange protein DsbD-like protein [Fibrobacteria bacterium]|jgi:thiol:disulfide interchange protein DsbD|nr:thiol-disulfide interchange protein DsbD-like protein [Fibrobacteria bacterium]
MHLAYILFLAFLGGIVLNLMPCVLPVLSLKIFDFVQRAGKRSRVMAHGLCFAAGTILSFWVLAGLLIALRQGGRGLGWGFQLQSPSFLVILCALFTFFALHLFGVFEMGYLFTRIKRGHEKDGLPGSFLAGVTATLVATPCTGPFMGTAMAYAFTQSAWVSFLVFTALALGVAFPYLLLSSVPGLARFLPKPGAWMEHLKQFMGFPLLATVIWLAWVFGRQTSIDSMGMLLALLLVAGLSAWILGKWMHLRHPGHIRLTAALVALVIFMPTLAWVLAGVRNLPPMMPRAASAEPGGSLKADGSIDWRSYTPENLAALRAAGKAVFIDFTADWCLTCKVNEKAALNRPEVAKAFAERNIVALKADWTNTDEAVTKALEGYGRNSIPLYVYYPAGGGDYKLLPQVLTVKNVVGSL